MTIGLFRGVQKHSGVTAMLLASGDSQICLHTRTPSKISSANNRVVFCLLRNFLHLFSREQSYCVKIYELSVGKKKPGADSRCSFANREMLLLHLLRFFFI